MAEPRWCFASIRGRKKMALLVRGKEDGPMRVLLYVPRRRAAALAAFLGKYEPHDENIEAAVEELKRNAFEP